jgi:hypothetical protein
MTQNNPQQAVFEPAYDTEYRRIVNPDRVVVMPGYSLRLLAHGDLTPRELSLWLAFRQGGLRHLAGRWQTARDRYGQHSAPVAAALCDDEQGNVYWNERSAGRIRSAVG